MKFCAFCGEAHNEDSATCSEECADELIKHEFAQGDDVTRTCLWCPRRGDTAKFKFENCCLPCFSARKRHGACNLCGGPLDAYKTCHSCTPVTRILYGKNRLRPIAGLLVDRRRERARIVIYGAIKGMKTARVPIVAVNRKEFESPVGRDLMTRFANSRSYRSFNPGFLDRVAHNSQSRRVLKNWLKLAQRVGSGASPTAWLDHIDFCSSNEPEAKARNFERGKNMLRDIGVNVQYVLDEGQHTYRFKEQKVSDMLTYVYTIERNLKLGYHWK